MKIESGFVTIVDHTGAISRISTEIYIERFFTGRCKVNGETRKVHRYSETPHIWRMQCNAQQIR